MNDKQSIPTSFIIGAIAIIILIIGGIGFATNQSNNESNNNDSETSETAKVDDQPAQTMSESPTTPNLAQVVGTYSGSSSLLTSSLVFPESTFELDQLGNVSLTAQGLNLAAFGNPALQVQGLYPDVTILASANAIPQSDGTVLMEVTGLIPSFSINGTTLDQSTSLALAQGLAAAGIIIPTATTEQPIEVGTNVTLTPNGSLTISNTEATEIAISFNGTKQ